MSWGTFFWERITGLLKLKALTSNVDADIANIAKAYMALSCFFYLGHSWILSAGAAGIKNAVSEIF